MTTSAKVRERLVETLRRDLVGPGAQDADLARERLSENPSRWYLTGFLAPAFDAPESEEDDPSVQEELELEAETEETTGTGGAAADNEPPETPNTRRRFLPSSIGITVLLPIDATKIDARVSWGDYVTEPPLPEGTLLPETANGEGSGQTAQVAKRPDRPRVDWVRVPQSRTVTLSIGDGRERIVVPESAAPQRKGGGLELTIHSRAFAYETPEGTKQRVRAVTVFLVNRRAMVHRRYSDIAYIFQARLELSSAAGFCPRFDLSASKTSDEDLRIADLHYRDVTEFAVGRSAAASWMTDDDGVVRRVWTDPLPLAEVERVAPNETMTGVEFGMEALGRLARAGAAPLAAALEKLPELYGVWISGQQAAAQKLPSRRRETAVKLVASMETAQRRIVNGIELLRNDDRARLAFRLMNEAIATAARRRNAGHGGDPAMQKPPAWRPFQLAFIILTLAGLVDKTNEDREVVDLLFFPTGGGKTEAYLGLAAFAIAHRRLSASGILGAGVCVIMRYTLRLLTLDQLARAAGVVCALELMRTDPVNVGSDGRPLLGDWPIEIGLWVGSDASPNQMGGRGNTGDETAVTRVRRYRQGHDKRAPAPIKACPWCGTPFTQQSFSCVPNNNAPRNLEIRCANERCDFTRERALPILTVDEPIYRRLPAFLIATVDKFAGLPWVGGCGAFFGHVDRFDPGQGFYGASEPGLGEPLDNGAILDPPDLIIQDELHLISGPLGTVAGLYETAIDRLSTRQWMGKRVRPKIVASTATVRRAETQIRALFDRQRTEVFPPPAVSRRDSFFAVTVPSSQEPARWYLGLAAQGRGPKLVFLRALTTLLAAAAAQYELFGGGKDNPADPYMTAVCYFNALRELGGARRIVEDEVRDRVSRYGAERRRAAPNDAPFADRRLREPLELTSRVSTDKVAEAKSQLELVFGGDGNTVDVALATNMISVGLDILRLGLMIVQGQPKTAAEYIQATSRVGRDPPRPGLIVTVLNLHKPRDRTHFEQFGHFHRTFYRAVEATSVTPWAARALDRALAAVVVAIVRHLDPEMTPERAVEELAQHPDTRKHVRDTILDRAPPEALVGGREALEQAIDSLLDDWINVAEEQTANGMPFPYSGKGHRLLHMPLDPALPNLTVEHQRFVAGRSMRDVEPNVHLKVRDPSGAVIAHAEDTE